MKNEKGKILRVVQIVLITIILYNFGSVILQQKAKYTTFSYWKGFPQLEKQYNESQYVNKHPKGWIPDEAVNAYAGGALIKGTNPILIISDTPPLGKYLFGLSALLFNNENIIILIFSAISLALLYLIGLQIYSFPIMALLPVVLFSFEPIFKNQLIYSPLYDIVQLVFLQGIIYAFNRAVTAKSNSIFFFIIVGIFIGLFISTKFYITGVVIFAACYLPLLFSRNFKKMIYFTLTFPVAIIVLLLSYIRIFAFGYTIRSFFGIQKWIFLYHKTQLILPFSIWPLLLLNQWHVWFGKQPILHDPQWLITWPVTTVLTFITVIFYLTKKIHHKKEIEVIMAWNICYLAFFSIGQITTRYFVILIPFLYLVSIYGIESLLFSNKYTTDASSQK